MDHVSVSATVIFQEPFWRVIFERTDKNQLSVCRVTFGTEPRDYEVQELILRAYFQLRFSPAVAADMKVAKVSPKRMQRQVQRQLENTGIGTKSQQALKLQQEQIKTERKSQRHELREAEKQRQFQLKQRKKKEKHRGR